MPRLLIDATPITRNNKGVSRYAHSLCVQLSHRLDDTWQIGVLIHPGHESMFPTTFKGEFLLVRPCAEVVKGVYWTSYWMWKWRADLLLRTNDCAGFVGLKPAIVVCHDIHEMIVQAQADMPRSWIGRGVDFIKNSLRKEVLRRSDLVICNSHFIQEEVSRFYGVPRERTALGYCGVDTRFYAMSPLVNKKAVYEKYGVERFILTFATGDTRENFGLLPEIAWQLKQKGVEIPILIAGFDPQKPYAQKLKASFMRYDLEEGRHYLFETFLDESRFSELVALYTAAACYLELSLHEGFGMQLAEAMACGAQCFSTGCGALAEIGGSFVYDIDPYIPQKIADVIEQNLSVLNTEKAFDREGQIAFTQRYTWDQVGSVVSHF
uniref:Putative GT4: distantly related to mannosyltransferases n=1 Tax=Magnetococcus massalia (strain MO-1) TaxID=451514 RepID=A0A1S7LDZ4_MAGMO|nr:Putative GT4 : distantly related to mannosyltransferases [Candidatus Magnetococcus massalia]